MKLQIPRPVSSGLRRVVAGMMLSFACATPCIVLAQGGATLDVTPGGRAPAGSTVTVRWSGPNGPGDYITVVRPGARPFDYLNYQHTSNGRTPVNPVSIVLPAEPGAYEIRYVVGNPRSVLAAVPYEVVAVAATIDAPATVTPGARFEISWSGPNNGGDWVTIVAAGAAPRAYGSYVDARGDRADARTASRSGTLRAPAQAGRYELRYVQQGRLVIGTRPIDVAVGAVSNDCAAAGSAPAGSAAAGAAAGGAAPTGGATATGAAAGGAAPTGGATATGAAAGGAAPTGRTTATGAASGGAAQAGSATATGAAAGSAAPTGGGAAPARSASATGVASGGATQAGSATATGAAAGSAAPTGGAPATGAAAGGAAPAGGGGSAATGSDTSTSGTTAPAPSSTPQLTVIPFIQPAQGLPTLQSPAPAPSQPPLTMTPTGAANSLPAGTGGRLTQAESPCQLPGATLIDGSTVVTPGGVTFYWARPVPNAVNPFAPPSPFGVFHYIDYVVTRNDLGATPLAVRRTTDSIPPSAFVNKPPPFGFSHATLLSDPSRTYIYTIRSRHYHIEFQPLGQLTTEDGCAVTQVAVKAVTPETPVVSSVDAAAGRVVISWQANDQGQTGFLVHGSGLPADGKEVAHSGYPYPGASYWSWTCLRGRTALGNCTIEINGGTARQSRVAHNVVLGHA